MRILAPPAARFILPGAVVLGLGLLASSSAMARTPATHALVTNVVPTLQNSHRIDGATAYVGLTQCKLLVENNRSVAFRFDTAIDTLVESSDGFTLFRDAAFYSVVRDATSAPNCDNEDACPRISEDLVNQTADNITVGLPFRTLTGITSAEECEEEHNDEYFVRIHLRADVLNDVWHPIEGRLILDTIRPEPPAALTAVATQTIARVSWEDSPSDDVTGHVAVVSTSPFAGGAFPDEAGNLRPRAIRSLGAGRGEVTIDQTPGTTVYIGLASQDETGNYSELTEPIEATVIETADFWDGYIEAGGQEMGGYCSVSDLSRSSRTPLGPLAMLVVGLAIAGVSAARRRH